MSRVMPVVAIAPIVLGSGLVADGGRPVAAGAVTTVEGSMPPVSGDDAGQSIDIGDGERCISSARVRARH